MLPAVVQPQCGFGRAVSGRAAAPQCRNKRKHQHLHLLDLSRRLSPKLSYRPVSNRKSTLYQLFTHWVPSPTHSLGC